MASGDRRAAARLIHERSDADPEWIAALWGVEPGWYSKLAAREGWRRSDSGDLGGLIDRLIRRMSAELAALEVLSGEEGTGGESGFSKPRLDALLAITRTFDKLSEMRRAEDERRGGEGDGRALDRARSQVEARVGELAEQRVETIIDHLKEA